MYRDWATENARRDARDPPARCRRSLQSPPSRSGYCPVYTARLSSRSPLAVGSGFVLLAQRYAFFESGASDLDVFEKVRQLFQRERLRTVDERAVGRGMKIDQH